MTVGFSGHERFVRPVELVQRPFLKRRLGASVPRAVIHVHAKRQKVVHRLGHLFKVHAFRSFRSRKVTQIVFVAFPRGRAHFWVFVDAALVEVQLEGLGRRMG